MGMMSLPLMNPEPALASCTDDTTAWIILETRTIVPLWVGCGESGRMRNFRFWLRYMMSPVRDRALNSHRYNALDWAQRCISLAKCLILAAGCVAA